MRLLLILTALFCTTSVFGQVSFETFSLEEALEKSKDEGKLVFVQFESTCEQCNDLANKSFENPELVARMEQTLVCLKIDLHHSQRQLLAARYNLNPEKSFASIFLDQNGVLLHTYATVSSSYKEYLKQIDLAYSKAGEALKISALEKEYNAGNHSFGLIEAMLFKRKQLNLDTETLLEDYIDALPADSLKAIHTIQIIAQMAPMIDSRAYKLIHQDRALFQQAWDQMSSSVRTSINNATIHKCMDKAIRNKDENYALRTASFARGSNANAVVGVRVYEMNMLRYYEGVHDTTNYFRKAIGYYDRYFMAISAASIKRVDSMNLQRMMTNALKDTLRNGNTIRIRSQVSFAPAAQRLSSELGHGALVFYQSTENPYLPAIATDWIKHSIEFYSHPFSYDTYARLLYKQWRKHDALEAMKQALKLQQQRGLPIKRYEEAIAHMNNDEKLD